MATIITREVGVTATGIPLSNTEIDNNFINLNNDISSRISNTEKGVANGVATLDATGLVPISQLPESGASIDVGTSPPLLPEDNSLWWDSESGTLKIYYNDGTSSQWVDASASEKSAVVSESSGTSSAYSNQYTVSGITANATETEIFINGVTNSRIPVALNTVCAYTMDIVAKRTDVAGDAAMFTVKSIAKNVAGTVTDVGGIYEVVVARTDINLNVDVRADNTTGSIQVFVTGVAGKTFNWKAVISTVEI